MTALVERVRAFRTCLPVDVLTVFALTKSSIAANNARNNPPSLIGAMVAPSGCGGSAAISVSRRHERAELQDIGICRGKLSTR